MFVKNVEYTNLPVVQTVFLHSLQLSWKTSNSTNWNNDGWKSHLLSWERFPISKILFPCFDIDLVHR